MFKKENGFTLIEMLIVLMIIAVLILIIVPTIGERSKDVHNHGCDALILTVQTQADAYRLEEGSYPKTLDKLKEAKYITDNQLECRNEKKLTINNDGIVDIQQ